MAKQSNAKAAPTPEEVVAQNGGLETATPVVEETAKAVEVVEEEVVQPAETTEVVEEVATPAPTTPVVEEAAPVVETPATPAVAPEVVETVEEVAQAPVAEVAEKTMDCLGLKNHTCRIGGNVITVSKDKVQTFTAGVATVLQRAGVVIVK